jgi:tetratricopeptide (TPR) repeat protein
MYDVVPMMYEGISMTDPQAKPVLTAEAWLALGQERQRQWDMEGTLVAFSKALELNANFAEAYTARARAYRDFSYTDPTYREQAIADYSSAINLQPAQAMLYHDRGFTYAELGSHHSRQGNEHSAITAFDAALTDCEAATQLDIQLMPQIHQLQIMIYNGRGLSRRAIGQAAAAIADFDRGLALEPNNPMLLMNRGGTLSNSGNHTQALFDLDTALGQSPELLIINMMRGTTRLNQGDYSGAIDDFTTSRPELQAPELAARIYFQRGSACLQIQDYDRAIADFSEVIRLNTQDMDAWYSRGYAYFQKQALDESARDMESVLRIDPTHVAAQAALAEIKQIHGS